MLKNGTWEENTVKMLLKKGMENWTMQDKAEYDYITKVHYSLTMFKKH